MSASLINQRSHKLGTIEDVHHKTVSGLRARNRDRAREVVDLREVDIHDIVATVIVADLCSSPICHVCLCQLSHKHGMVLHSPTHCTLNACIRKVWCSSFSHES